MKSNVCVFKKNVDLNAILAETDKIAQYNELTKNYSQDRKTFDLIQNKFQDLNLNLMMIIDNNKFVDSLILFERVRTTNLILFLSKSYCHHNSDIFLHFFQNIVLADTQNEAMFLH